MRGREWERGAPINVFIHGGAWRARQVKDYAFLAEIIVRAGGHWIGLDFDGVEGTGGDLLPMADQVRRGVAWVTRTRKASAAIRIGSTCRPVVRRASRRQRRHHRLADYGVPNDVVKGALLCSGMYELKPVRLSKRSEYVAFTDEAEQKLSSQRRLDRLNCPVIVAYGTYETPEFQRQNREFAAAVKAAGKPVTLLVAEGYNHFEIAEAIGNPLSLLGAAVLEQMKLV